MVRTLKFDNLPDEMHHIVSQEVSRFTTRFKKLNPNIAYCVLQELMARLIYTHVGEPSWNSAIEGLSKIVANGLQEIKGRYG